MLFEFLLAASLAGNLKIVKPAVAPPAAIQPSMRRYRDLRPPFDLIDITEEQYRQMKTIQRGNLEVYEKLEEELRQMDREFRELQDQLEDYLPKEPREPGEGDGDGVA